MRVKQRLETTAIAWLPMTMCLFLSGFLAGWPVFSQFQRESNSMSLQRADLAQRVSELQEAQTALHATQARLDALSRTVKLPSTTLTGLRLANRESLFAALLDSFQRNSIECLETGSAIDENDPNIVHQKTTVIGSFEQISKCIEEITDTEVHIAPKKIWMSRPTIDSLCEWELEFELGVPKL